MSVETDVFIATDFIPASQTWTYTLFGGGVVDDAFWDISIVPQGTNNSVSLIGGPTVSSDAAGVRSMTFTVQNNSFNDTFFTRAAVRIPNF